MGVINPRGSVVPVVDMRLKLGLASTEKTKNGYTVAAERELPQVSKIIFWTCRPLTSFSFFSTSS